MYPFNLTVHRVHSTLIEHKFTLLSVQSIWFNLFCRAQVYLFSVSGLHGSLYFVRAQVYHYDFIVNKVHSYLVDHKLTLLSVQSLGLFYFW